jgi:hypothetical protein
MNSSSVYRKITRALFWGVAIPLSVISWILMEKFDLIWNLWVELADSIFILATAFALSRLIPRWLNIADDR